MNELPIHIKITHSDSKLQKRLDWFLQQPGCTWTTTPRGEERFPELAITRRGVFLTNGTERLAFHPSMALIRLINLRRGESDRFLEATKIIAGDSLIDATLGLGSDALIAAWAVGETGKVLAFEQSPVLAAMVQDGLSHINELITNSKNEEKQVAWATLAEASHRIQISWGDHIEFLRRIPTSSVDIVYFDPMFRQTLQQSKSIQPLHQWSDHKPLDHKAIYEACRIARKRVVLKERKNSSEFQRLGFEILLGGQYSPVDYGVILV